MKFVSLICVLVLLALSPGRALAQGTNPPVLALDHQVFLPAIALNASRFTVTPNPLDLAVTLDSARRSALTVPTSGGSLSATAADGTVFTLVVPQDALVAETAIALTPVVSVTGLPGSIQFVAGVDLQPDGVRFYKPVTLTVKAPAGSEIPVDREVAFASAAGGKSAYLQPLASAPRTPTFQLLHFTLAYLGQGDSSSSWRDFDQYVPASAEDRLQGWLASLLHDERVAQQNRVPGDPDLIRKLEALAREYFSAVLLPLLGRAETNCSDAAWIIPRIVGWMRQLDLFGLKNLDQERNTLMTSESIALGHCWSELTQPCLNWNDPAQVKRVLEVVHQDQLLEKPHGFDPYAVPACDCSAANKITAGWNIRLTFTYAYEQRLTADDGGYQYVRRERSADVTARLDHKDPFSTGLWQGYLTGTTHYLDRNDLYSPPPPEERHDWTNVIATGSPRAVDREGADVQAWLALDTAHCRYDIWVPDRIDAALTDSTGNSFTTDVVAGNFQGYGLPLPWTPASDDFSLTEMWVLTPNSEVKPARLQLGVLPTLDGPFPDVQVTWSISPIAPATPTDLGSGTRLLDTKAPRDQER